MSKVLAVIPARGGSKSIPGKNIKLLNGKPLIAYAIEAGLACKGIDRLIVSSDDQDILAIARQYGAETPFVRPSELAQDKTPDRPVFQHALNFLAKEDNYHPDLVLNLRPTTPFRSTEDIENVIQKWMDSNADSVRTVTKVEGVHHPYWMFNLDKQGWASPAVPGKTIEEYYQRQLLPPMYRLNGVVDGMLAEVVLHHKYYYGDKMALVEVPEERAHDIDTKEDFSFAEYLITQK